MSYLLDTNVISEARKGANANPGVQSWFADASSDDLYLSVLVVGELRHGIELRRRRDSHAGAHLDRWLTQITRDFSDRILPVGDQVADRWGRMGVPDPVPSIDGLLAATALVHDLILVTRNTSHLGATGALLVNPFT